MSAPALPGILSLMGATPNVNAHAGAAANSAADRQLAREAARSSFAQELQQARTTAAPATVAPAPPQTPPRAPTHGQDNRMSRRAAADNETEQARPAAPSTTDRGAEPPEDGTRTTNPPSPVRARTRSRDSREATAPTTPPSAGTPPPGDSTPATSGSLLAATAAVRARRASAAEGGDDGMPMAPASPQPVLLQPPTAQAVDGPAARRADDATQRLSVRSPLADEVGPQPAPGQAVDNSITPRVPSLDQLHAAGAADADATRPAGPALPPRAASAADTVPSQAVAGSRQAPSPLLPGEVPSLASALQAVQAERLGLPESPSTSSMQATPAFAADLARAMATPGAPLVAAGPAATPAPTVLELPTPVTSPDFVPRLSGELAVLARDGVQEARINVHPVELGPISVQIALEGVAAQVHLAADNAQTRELLQQAMPALAAALRENGLTLTGGGVFQQARQNAQDGRREGSPNATNPAAGQLDRIGTDEDGRATAGVAARRLRAIGGLDVYA